jgi:hypothetical protein
MSDDGEFRKSIRRLASRPLPDAIRRMAGVPDPITIRHPGPAEALHGCAESGFYPGCPFCRALEGDE